MTKLVKLLQFMNVESPMAIIEFERVKLHKRGQLRNALEPSIVTELGMWNVDKRALA